MFWVSLRIFYSWARALVFHLCILDWLPLLRSSTCCVTQDVATHCIYCLLCHMAFTSSRLQEYWSLVTQCFVLFLIHSLLPLSHRSWSSLLFSLLANVRVFNISRPLFRWSYAGICWCNWCLELCLGMKFLHFFLGGGSHLAFVRFRCTRVGPLLLIWSCHVLRIFRLSFSSSLDALISCNVLNLVYSCSLNSSLIFDIFFFTLSDPLTSSVPHIFASLRNTFLCCKRICRASVSALSMVTFLFSRLLLFVICLLSHPLSPPGLDALLMCLGNCYILGYILIMPFPWLCLLPCICSVLQVWTLFSDIRSLAFWVLGLRIRSCLPLVSYSSDPNPILSWYWSYSYGFSKY